MPFPLPLLRPPGSPRLLIMVTIGSLLPSPWRQPRSPSFPPMVVTSRPRCFRLWARAEREGVQGETPPPPLPPPSSEKKSFAVATGELFLGLASLLLRRAPGSPPPSLLTAEQKVVVSKEGVDEEVLYFSDRGEDVATAVEDRVDQEVIWEQRPEDVEAEKKRKKVTSPGFSFSAAGLLFPYHLGVAQLLLEKGYITETTPLSGSSAGAIVCVVIASGNTMQDALKAMKLLAEDCRTNGTAFRLGAVLRDVLQELLPDDVHVRSNGSVRVAVTQLLWRPRGLLVDQFDSKEDLINAVFTSSFIPGYLAPRPATIFRNRLCIDGGLTLFMPPTSASETVIQATATDNYGLVEALVSHMCDIDQKQLVLYAQMANLVNLVLPAMEINIKEVTEIFSKLACNAHTICDSELRPLGTGLYPIISIINHSCLPNSVLLFEGRRAVVRSVEPIVEGTEISISYIDTASSTKKRQKDLNEQYFFTCACPRCKKANYYEDANENESALEGYRCMDRKCSGFLVFDSQEKKFTCQQCALSRDHQAIKRIEKELKDLADKASKSLSSCCILLVEFKLSSNFLCYV